VIDETKKVLTERGVAGRLSTWPAPASMMWTVTCTRYAIKWINGEVPKDKIDFDVYGSLCADYILDVTGEVINVDLQPLELDGRVYSNFVMALMDYLNY
jgi:hypothetical protein